MTELKPCPFCGSTKIKLWHSPFGVGGRCEMCGANSGYGVDFNGETKEDAANAWNRRVYCNDGIREQMRRDGVCEKDIDLALSTIEKLKNKRRVDNG